MRATVITDASFCQQQCVGGWAAWVAMDNGLKIKQAGPLTRQAPANSIQAELMAVINGIWLAHTNGATYILVQSDCEGALHVLNGRSRSEALNKIWQAAMDRYGFFQTLETRHVKGHTTNGDARSWVNRWCDMEARKYMKAARNVPRRRRA